MRGTTDVQTPYTIKQEDLEQLDGEWQDLLALCRRPWPFLQPAWQRVWWSDLPPAAVPRLYSVRDGDRLVAVVPLLDRGEEFALAGDSEICDYMDIVCTPGSEAAVLESLFRELDALPWRRFIFWGMRADSPSLPALTAFAERAKLDLSIEQEAVCPRVALPPTWEGFLEGLSKKDRHELRRKLRRFASVSGAINEYALSDPVQIEAGLDDFLRLHTISRQDKAAFMTPPMERFFRDMAVTLARQDLVRLYFLECAGKRVASVLAFEVGDELWLYNSGFDPAYSSVSVGLVSKAMAMRQAIAEGKRCYDFLRGSEPYKYDLGGQDLEVFRCTLRRDGNRPY